MLGWLFSPPLPQELANLVPKSEARREGEGRKKENYRHFNVIPGRAEGGRGKTELTISYVRAPNHMHGKRGRLRPGA